MMKMAPTPRQVNNHTPQTSSALLRQPCLFFLLSKHAEVQRSIKTRCPLETRDGSWHLYLQELGVDLELGGGAALLLGGLLALLDALEEVVDGPRDDTQVLVRDVDVEACPHGVGLPRARLQDREEEKLARGRHERRCSTLKLAYKM